MMNWEGWIYILSSKLLEIRQHRMENCTERNLTLIECECLDFIQPTTGRIQWWSATD